MNEPRHPAPVPFPGGISTCFPASRTMVVFKVAMNPAPEAHYDLTIQINHDPSRAPCQRLTLSTILAAFGRQIRPKEAGVGC